VFEPFFDIYIPSITLNGGVPVYCPIRKNELTEQWAVDFDELRSKITSKTKMILLNTPHNPIGKVFSAEELNRIADLAKEFNLLVVSDEVVSGTNLFTDQVLTMDSTTDWCIRHFTG
jgi:kynurenine aminotransferase